MFYEPSSLESIITEEEETRLIKAILKVETLRLTYKMNVEVDVDSVMFSNFWARGLPGWWCCLVVKQDSEEQVREDMILTFNMLGCPLKLTRDIKKKY